MPGAGRAPGPTEGQQRSLDVAQRPKASETSRPKREGGRGRESKRVFRRVMLKNTWKGGTLSNSHRSVTVRESTRPPSRASKQAVLHSGIRCRHLLFCFYFYQIPRQRHAAQAPPQFLSRASLIFCMTYSILARSIFLSHSLTSACATCSHLPDPCMRTPTRGCRNLHATLQVAARRPCL